MHERSILTALRRLAVRYGVEATEEWLSVHVEDLGHLDNGQIRRMYDAARSSTAQFMPRPGQLLSMALRGESDPELEAHQEFGRLSEALSIGKSSHLRPRTRRIALKFAPTFSELARLDGIAWSMLRKPWIAAYIQDCELSARTGEDAGPPAISHQTPREPTKQIGAVSRIDTGSKRLRSPHIGREPAITGGRNDPENQNRKSNKSCQK